MTMEANSRQIRSESAPGRGNRSEAAAAERVAPRAVALRDSLAYSRLVSSQELPRRSRATRRGDSVVYVVGKRVFDLVLGLCLLLGAVPFILTAAIAIRLETKGSPFFVQTRLGRHGRPFKIFKLRGMFIDARTRFASFYDYSKHKDLEFCFHHEQDPRVTRAGRFIRKTSIDELPNLWNVVLGDMSLVGPRPEIPEVLALYGTYRDEYLSVKPGVTC
ncbi:MAG: sugar transferase, partial [Pseudomonadota bacterium]|nr:sugar transferase [Pseudomonadota bacterium]